MIASLDWWRGGGGGTKNYDNVNYFVMHKL